MDALLDAKLPGACVGVVSNRPAAAGLAIAAARDVPVHVIDHTNFATREAFDDALAEWLEALQPDLILLAGFMRILSAGFVERFAGRLLNIHPSLLPAFPGIRTHEQALAAGVRIHGCSVHFVTPALDGGPIIAQAAVAVLSDDDETSLATRVLSQEHQLFPRVARWFLEDRIGLDANGCVAYVGESATGAVLHVPSLRG